MIFIFLKDLFADPYNKLLLKGCMKPETKFIEKLNVPDDLYLIVNDKIAVSKTWLISSIEDLDLRKVDEIELQSPKPKPIKIENEYYFLVSRLKEYSKEVFEKCKKDRSVIELKNLNEKDYIFACEYEDGWEKSHKANTRAKILLHKNWCDIFVFGLEDISKKMDDVNIKNEHKEPFFSNKFPSKSESSSCNFEQRSAKNTGFGTSASYKDTKKMLGIHAQGICCIYLIRIGYVDVLRDSMKINKSVDDNYVVIKFGKTIDLKKRLAEHNASFQSRYKNTDIKLLKYICVHESYLTDSEAKVSEYFCNSNCKLDVEKQNELIAIPNDKNFLKKVKAFLCEIGNNYNKEIHSLRDIIEQGKNHEKALMATIEEMRKNAELQKQIEIQEIKNKLEEEYRIKVSIHETEYNKIIEKLRNKL